MRLGADDVEVYGISTRDVEAFLERNDIRFGKSHKRSIVGIRVLKEGSIGFSSVNTLDHDAIENAARHALLLARNAPGDKNNTFPTDSRSHMISGIYDKTANNFTASNTLEMALEMLETARNFDSRIKVDSGTFNSSIYECAIKNSNGIERCEMTSLFTWAIMGMAVQDSDISNFDYQMSGTHRVNGIDVSRTARIFAENVVNSLGARRIGSFRGEIILTPQAVTELMIPTIVSSLNSNNVQKGMSRFKDRMDDVIASHSVTIRDDGTDPEGLDSSSFDREGVQKSPLTLVEDGVLKSFMYNAYTAKKDGTSSTGHAIGSPRSSPVIGSSNMILDAGTMGKDDLIRDMKNGILVTRFSGNTSAVSGDFSGVVKGGFLVRKGEIVHSVKETLIAGNIFDLLMNVTGVSRETERLDVGIFPYLKVDDVAVTGG